MAYGSVRCRYPATQHTATSYYTVLNCNCIDAASQRNGPGTQSREPSYILGGLGKQQAQASVPGELNVLTVTQDPHLPLLPLLHSSCSSWTQRCVVPTHWLCKLIPESQLGLRAVRSPLQPKRKVKEETRLVCTAVDTKRATQNHAKLQGNTASVRGLQLGTLIVFSASWSRSMCKFQEFAFETTRSQGVLLTGV